MDKYYRENSEVLREQKVGALCFKWVGWKMDFDIKYYDFSYYYD